MDLFWVLRKQANTKVKDPMKVMYYILTICLSLFHFGYTLIYISAVSFDVVVEEFKIDIDKSFAQGIFQGILPIGGAFGAISSSYFVQKLSRKNLVNFCNILGATLVLLSLITNYKILFIVRFFEGYVCGLQSAMIPVIVKQNSPADMINITGAFSNIAIIFGLFFVYFFSFCISAFTGDWTGISYWQIVFAFPIVTQVTQSILLRFVYPFQTPKYLAEINQKEQVRKLLQQFYKKQYIEDMCEQVMKNYGPLSAASNNLQSQVKENQPCQSKCGLFYGIFYALLCPMVGVNALMSYGGQAASKVAPQLAPIMPSILMLLFLIFSTLSIPFVSKYGRKQLTFYGTIAIVVILYAISYGYFISQSQPALAQTIIVTAFLLFLMAYGLTFAPVMWIWVSEAVQPKNIGYPIMANWFGAASVMIMFPIALKYLPQNNPAYIFLFFGTYGLISLYITNKFMIQTKGKKQLQIFNAYKELDRQFFGTSQEKKDFQLGLLKNERTP